MKVHVEGRSTGVVRLLSSGHRTLTGGHFHASRKQRIEIPLLLEEDVHVIQAATEPLRFLFPSLEWDEWGIEILDGHTCVAEVLIEEQTLLIERKALDHFSLLSWELFGAFLQSIFRLDFGDYLEEDEIPLLALVAQFSWFCHEGEEWQKDILTFLPKHGTQQLKLTRLLWSILPAERRYMLHQSIQLSDPECILEQFEDDSSEDRDLWHIATDYLQVEPIKVSSEAALEQKDEKFAPFYRAFSVCSLLPWEAVCGVLPGMLARYFFEVKASASSTKRRLGLFRIIIEQCLRTPELLVEPFAWPRMSILVLDRDRHPKIHQALLQFLELTQEREKGILWSLLADENILAKLALQNQLSEQDDRFFRQATHVQAIWRDILHRSASQEWASSLLFDSFERVVAQIEAEPDLLFAAVIWNRTMWENAPSPIAPDLQNLRVLLWILSQAPLSVLRRLYPEDEPELVRAQQRWPLFRTHLKRFLHLAPQMLSRLCDQLEDEQGRPTKTESHQKHFEIEADPDIPQQELHGRILPLLERPDLERYQRVDLERTEVLRVLHLDRYLHQSSGLWKEHRFFSSFLLFFKTSHDRDEGGWAELALWIDKDLDLGKVSNRKGMAPTIRGLLLEDGIWERTYRYQFLTVEQLMEKLNPGVAEWKQLLQLLGSEYAELIEQRLREVLDYQYYLMRGSMLHSRALTTHLDEPGSHPLWCLPIEEFESIKEALVGRMAARVLRAFYHLQLQDDRCWKHAHMTITQRVRDISALLSLAPGSLPFPKSDSSDLHHWCAEVLENWTENPDSFASLPQDADSWMKGKKALIQRLVRSHYEGARAFVQFLLEQFSVPLRVVELLMNQPFEEEGEPVFFKPIPTSIERAERHKEFVPFLRDEKGQLISPAFLHLFCHIPRSLLHSTIKNYPDLLEPLQQVSKLLRDIDRDGEQAHLLWETIEELRTLQNKPLKEGLPTPSTKEIPPPIPPQKGTIDA